MTKISDAALIRFKLNEILTFHYYRKVNCSGFQANHWKPTDGEYTCGRVAKEINALAFAIENGTLRQHKVSIDCDEVTA